MRKYKLDGREYATYELSNNQLVELYEGRHGKLSVAETEEIRETIVSRFKCYDCTKPMESRDELFARQFSNFVNGKMESPKAVAKQMGNEHRYLQQEMFKVCLEYIKVLAKHYAHGHYDARNETACDISSDIVAYLKADGLL